MPQAEVAQFIFDHEIGSYVTGKDPICVDPIFADQYQKPMIHDRRGIIIHAISGVDCTLWDIIGKVTGQLIHKLLGGLVSPSA